MSKALRTWRRRVTRHIHDRMTRDRGAGAIEYAGIVIIVAGIILAIKGLGLDTAISGAIANAVNGVLGG